MFTHNGGVYNTGDYNVTWDGNGHGPALIDVSDPSERHRWATIEATLST